MSVTVDALKDLATSAMVDTYGASIGNAYAFLMFGGYGVPGVVDGATLAVKADSTAAVDLTEDLAVSAVADSAKAGLTAFLSYYAEDALDAIGLGAETVAAASMLVVTGIFSPTPIGIEPATPLIGPAANIDLDTQSLDTTLFVVPDGTEVPDVIDQLITPIIDIPVPVESIQELPLRRSILSKVKVNKK